MKNQPIEQQIAELTPEQKNNMPRIYKRFVICHVLIICICLAIAIGGFLYGSHKMAQIKEQRDSIQSILASPSKYELENQYYDMSLLRFILCGVGGGVGLIGVLVIHLIFKHKYPYFSEKKYEYLKSINYYKECSL